MANKRTAKRGRTPGTSRDTRRPLEPTPIDREKEALDSAAIEARVAAGELSFRDVHGLAVAEQHEVNGLYELQSTWLRRMRDDPPSMSPLSVPHPASRLTFERVLRAVPGVEDRHVEAILHEYRFDGSWTFAEIGTAEADVVESAVRLLLGQRRAD